MYIHNRPYRGARRSKVSLLKTYQSIALLSAWQTDGSKQKIFNRAYFATLRHGEGKRVK